MNFILNNPRVKARYFHGLGFSGARIALMIGKSKTTIINWKNEDAESGYPWKLFSVQDSLDIVEMTMKHNVELFGA